MTADRSGTFAPPTTIAVQERASRSAAAGKSVNAPLPPVVLARINATSPFARKERAAFRSPMAAARTAISARSTPRVKTTARAPVSRSPARSRTSVFHQVRVSPPAASVRRPSITAIRWGVRPESVTKMVAARLNRRRQPVRTGLAETGSITAGRPCPVSCRRAGHARWTAIAAPASALPASARRDR